MIRQRKAYFKLTLFLNVVRCTLSIETSVSEGRAASIFRVEWNLGDRRTLKLCVCRTNLTIR